MASLLAMGLAAITAFVLMADMISNWIRRLGYFLGDLG